MTKYTLSDQSGSDQSVESTMPAALLKAFGASVAEQMRGWNTGAWVLTGRDGEDLVATKASPAAVDAAMAAADVSVGPRVLEVLDGWLICERLYGSHLTPLELHRPPVLDDLATVFARLHSTLVALPEASMLDSLRQYAEEVGSSIDAGVARAVAWADDALTELTAHATRRVFCHLDVAANVIATPPGLRIIDFDFAALADPAQDSANCCGRPRSSSRGRRS